MTSSMNDRRAMGDTSARPGGTGRIAVAIAGVGNCAASLLQGIEFVKDVKTKEQFPANPGFGVRVGRRALQNGLLCRFDPHWLAFGPALNVTEGQLDEMLGVLDKSVGEVLGEPGA